jgi:hypothetical protein
MRELDFLCYYYCVHMSLLFYSFLVMSYPDIRLLLFTFSRSSFIPSSHIANKGQWLPNFYMLPWDSPRLTYINNISRRVKWGGLWCVNEPTTIKKNSRSSRIFHLFPCEFLLVFIHVRLTLSGHIDWISVEFSKKYIYMIEFIRVD